MSPVSHILLLVLCGIMAVYLVEFCVKPHSYIAFTAYTALLLWQATWLHSPNDLVWWQTHWLPLEVVVLFLLLCSMHEVFYFGTEEFPPVERGLLLSALCGVGIWFASFVFRWPDGPGLLSIGIIMRDHVYVGSFGFLTGWLPYAIMTEHHVSRSVIAHSALLLILTGGHTFSRPLGHYTFLPTSALFLPVAILAYLGWVTIFQFQITARSELLVLPFRHG